MDRNNLITVIIPVYNVEQYLRECVDSVLQQSYRQLEIILVNDGSTDQSGQICDDYSRQDQRIKVIHKTNGGLSAARNTGLSIAQGHYIYFLDSDDWIIPKALEKIKERADLDDVDFVFFNADCFFDPPSKQKIEQRYHRKYNYESGNGLKVLSYLFQRGEFHSSVPLLFFKKKFIDMHKLSFIEGILYEDMVFTFQAFCLAENVSYLPISFYQRRYRINSIMTSIRKEKNHKSACQVYLSVKNFIINNNLLNNGTTKKYLIRCAANTINIYRSLDNAERVKCKQEHTILTKDILANESFGNTALKMKIYGSIPWLLYKIYEKSLGRILTKNNL